MDVVGKQTNDAVRFTAGMRATENTYGDDSEKDILCGLLCGRSPWIRDDIRGAVGSP